MITKEQLRESVAVQDWLEEGRQEGRQEGMEQGAVNEARFALLSFLAIRFPELNVRDAVESISNVDALHSLLSAALKAPHSAAFLRVLRKSAQSSQ